MMLPNTPNNSSSNGIRRWVRHRTGCVQTLLALGMALAMLCPAAVDAGEPGREKLSKKLADRLEARSNELVQIIVDGAYAQV